MNGDIAVRSISASISLCVAGVSGFSGSCNPMGALEDEETAIERMARIRTGASSFPDEIAIQGDRRSAQKQLGNAVPSLLAGVLARQIRMQLLDRRAPSGRPRPLPPPRLPLPPAAEAGAMLVGRVHRCS